MKSVRVTSLLLFASIFAQSAAHARELNCSRYSYGSGTFYDSSYHTLKLEYLTGTPQLLVGSSLNHRSFLDYVWGRDDFTWDQSVFDLARPGWPRIHDHRRNFTFECKLNRAHRRACQSAVSNARWRLSNFGGTGYATQ